MLERNYNTINSDLGTLIFPPGSCFRITCYIIAAVVLVSRLMAEVF